MPLLSVRMRASLEGRHVSGAERIVSEDKLERTVMELLGRPSRFDRMVITVETLGEVEYLDTSLPVTTRTFETLEEARAFALSMLVRSGVPEEVARKALRLLSEGPSPSGGVMRGAVLMDVETGERLEPDRERGIRTVRVDWEDRERIAGEVLRRGLTLRTLDALVIATKNVHCGAVAELCWSDDPEYITGYVASRKIGYVRIHPLKEKGNPLGGRVYFIKREDAERFMECAERRALIVKRLPSS
jgi:6-carboxyhexanoate--CoA ligase